MMPPVEIEIHVYQVQTTGLQEMVKDNKLLLVRKKNFAFCEISNILTKSKHFNQTVFAYSGIHDSIL